MATQLKHGGQDITPKTDFDSVVDSDGKTLTERMTGITAATADKWTNARTITIGGDMTGTITLDGSKNVTAQIHPRYATSGVGDKNNYPFHRFAKIGAISREFFDAAITFLITQDHRGGGFGIVTVRLRTNNIDTNSTAEVRWLVRNGLADDSVQVGLYNVFGETYADVFFKSDAAYRGTVMRNLADGTRGGVAKRWDLVNSYEESDTTEDDPKTSFEVYKTIADAGEALHSQAYTNIITGVDGGMVSALTTSAGSATQPVYFADGKPVACTYPFADTSSDAAIPPSGKIYGVKFPLASYSSSPLGERTEAAVGLTAAVSTNETAAVNDFDNEPCFMFTRVNGYLKSDGEFVETAIEGDPAFKTDGTNGDVYVRWSTRFFRYIYTDTHEELQITDLYRPNEGWCPYGIFIKPDGRLRRYAYIAAYEMSYGADGKAASISGAPVAHNTYENRNSADAGLSHNTQLTEIRKKGGQYCGMTTKEVAFLQDMFSVEFATRNSQSIMQGATNFNYQKPLSVAETGVSRVIVSNADAEYYPVGCTVSVSQSGLSSAPDRNDAACHATLNRKRVVSHEVYDANNTAINIDTGGVTFDTSTTMYFTTMPWYTGMADAVKGTSGSYMSNTNGYYPMKYRGVENFYGNTFTIMSDIICKAYQPYICYDCTKFSTVPTSDYIMTSYTAATTSGGYVKALGYDENNSSVRIPIEVGGNSSAYYCDYYWVADGISEYLFGGSVNTTAYAGAWFWHTGNATTRASWPIAARLSVSGQSGKYTVQ